MKQFSKEEFERLKEKFPLPEGFVWFCTKDRYDNNTSGSFGIVRRSPTFWWFSWVYVDENRSCTVTQGFKESRETTVNQLKEDDTLEEVMTMIYTNFCFMDKQYED